VNFELEKHLKKSSEKEKVVLQKPHDTSCCAPVKP